MPRSRLIGLRASRALARLQKDRIGAGHFFALQAPGCTVDDGDWFLLSTKLRDKIHCARGSMAGLSLIFTVQLPFCFESLDDLMHDCIAKNCDSRRGFKLLMYDCQWLSLRQARARGELQEFPITVTHPRPRRPPAPPAPSPGEPAPLDDEARAYTSMYTAIIILFVYIPSAFSWFHGCCMYICIACNIVFRCMLGG